MINLLNNLLSLFKRQEPPIQKEEPSYEQEGSFLDKISSPEFLKKHPEFLERYLFAKKHKSLYIGEIEYFQDKKTGKTYFPYQPYYTEETDD